MISTPACRTTELESNFTILKFIKYNLYYQGSELNNLTDQIEQIDMLISAFDALKKHKEVFLCYGQEKSIMLQGK